MRLFTPFIFTIFMLISSNVHAETSARELQMYCEKAASIIEKGPEAISEYEDMFQVGRCMGMVEATLFQFTIDWRKSGCKSPGIHFMKGVEIFIKYLDAHPEKHQNPAAQEIWMGLAETFPCEIN